MQSVRRKIETINGSCSALSSPTDQRSSLLSTISATMNGKTIRIYLVDGHPTGILTAEIINWTGKIIVAPRSTAGRLSIVISAAFES
jgi:hypothetical protein